MLWTIVRREITANILSFRFLMGLLIYFSLIVTNLFVLTRGYEDRLQSYQTALRENEDKIGQVTRYSEFGLTHMLKCDRSPKLLSIFNEGVDKRKGNTVTVAHGYVPAVAEHHGSDNPYLNIFSSIDFTVICQVVMSLLALLFSYDAISREKEAGTLRLALSCAVPRPTLLLGKYIAGMVSISLPLIASFVAGLLVIQFSAYVSFSGSDWGRILLIFLLSMLYVSLFFLIGLFLSTRTDRPSITLMFSMCVWVLFVLIVPNLTILLVEHASPIQSEEPYKEQARDQWKQYEAEVKDYFEKRGVEGPLDRANFGGVGARSGVNNYDSGETVQVGGFENEEGVPFAQECYGFKENLRTQYADRIWQIRRAYLDKNPNRQSLLALNISRISPAAVYYNAAAILAETDLGSFWRFMEQTRQYRREWIDYLRDEKIFSSRRWFTTEFEAPFDLSRIPRFNEQSEGIGNSLQRASLDIMILALLNMLFFMGAFISFLRYDVV
ncbi:MAG: ABC transporter permease subunit [Candidatus Poribacteria bacterium]|nr:ABC transporter permease subunit [Candidatus Poribacteria bacterium]